MTNNKPVTPTQMVAIAAVRIEIRNLRHVYLMQDTDHDRLMVLYLDGLLAEIAVLESGAYPWDTPVEMTIYKGLESEGMETAPMFLDAFGRAIGAASAVLAGIAAEIRDSLWTMRKNFNPGTE